jgi:hypothetical protein
MARARRTEEFQEVSDSATTSNASLSVKVSGENSEMPHTSAQSSKSAHGMSYFELFRMILICAEFVIVA